MMNFDVEFRYWGNCGRIGRTEGKLLKMRIDLWCQKGDHSDVTVKVGAGNAVLNCDTRLEMETRLHALSGKNKAGRGGRIATGIELQQQQLLKLLCAIH